MIVNFEEENISSWIGRDLPGEQPPGIYWTLVKMRYDFRVSDKECEAHRWHLTTPREHTLFILRSDLTVFRELGKSYYLLFWHLSLVCHTWRHDMALTVFGAVQFTKIFVIMKLYYIKTSGYHKFASCTPSFGSINKMDVNYNKRNSIY